MRRSVIDILQNIINTRPFYASRIIANNTEMWKWVMQHCDPLCIDDKTRIYTAISGEKIQCPCGSGKLRKLSKWYSGLSFCGRAGKCSAAKEAVIKKCTAAAKGWDKKAAAAKRKTTNLKKYGITNTGQLEKSKLARKAVYDDPTKVKEILQKMQATNRERYGVDNPSQNPEIHKRQTNTMYERYGAANAIKIADFKNQMQQTNIERYGVPYASQNADIARKIGLTKKQTMLEGTGRPHETQIHISNDAWNILHDKDKFTELLTLLGRTELAKMLGVCVNTISVYHYNFGLDILKNSESAVEIEITNWLTGLNISSHKDRTICEGKELDFYIPSYNLAIEYNGLFWHSEARGKDKNYHYNKMLQCNKNNIHLIHIFEDEWIKNPNTCKSIIQQNLHLGNRIAARKCKIKEIPNNDMREFLNKNHLQGWVNGTHAYVLTYQDEIVAAMTFGKPRYNKQADWELLRLTFKNNTVIMGGAQKLWKFAINELQATSIISYCDRRWFTGAVYNKLGFTLKTPGAPTYWYTDYVSRWHRSKFTKKNLLKLSKNIDINPTQEDWSIYSESQITKDILGLDRIWDCGQDSWFWTK